MKNLLKSISVVGVMVGTMLPAASFAAAESKFGIVDIRTIIENSATAAVVSDRLQSEFQGQETSFRQTEASFIENRDRLERDKAIMSEGEVLSLERELSTAQRELQRLQTELTEEFSVRQRDEMQELMVSLKKVIDLYAEAEGFDLVFPSEMSLYFSEPVDITQAVMARLDKKD